MILGNESIQEVVFNDKNGKNKPPYNITLKQYTSDIVSTEYIFLENMDVLSKSIK